MIKRFCPLTAIFFLMLLPFHAFSYANSGISINNFQDPFPEVKLTVLDIGKFTLKTGNVKGTRKAPGVMLAIKNTEERTIKKLYGKMEAYNRETGRKVQSFSTIIHLSDIEIDPGITSRYPAQNEYIFKEYQKANVLSFFSKDTKSYIGDYQFKFEVNKIIYDEGAPYQN